MRDEPARLPACAACGTNSLAFGELSIEDWIELFEAGDAVQVVAERAAGCGGGYVTSQRLSGAQNDTCR
jgi:hypothetical protein